MKKFGFGKKMVQNSYWKNFLFWGEAEKNSFVALRGKGGYSGTVPLKTVCPNLERIGEKFYSCLKWSPDLL